MGAGFLSCSQFLSIIPCIRASRHFLGMEYGSVVCVVYFIFVEIGLMDNSSHSQEPSFAV
jgi:hypothetical protein